MDNILQEKIKVLLGIADTDIYDEELEMFIDLEKAKLKRTGFPVPETIATNDLNIYAVILSYNVAINLNVDVDTARLQTLYMTSVNTLRGKNEN